MTLGKGHGRHETRTVHPFEITPEQTGFPCACQAALITRTTHHLKSLKIPEENKFVISSRKADKMNASQLQSLRRGHWGIESIHYVRDVTFGEDASKVRTGHAPQNLAALRNLVIGLCALDGARKAKRASYLPRFRSVAKNHRQVAIDLICCPIMNGS